MKGAKISLLSSDSNAQMAWTMLRDAAHMLDMFDWAEVIQSMNRAHSVGHILDPTGYRALLHNPNVERNLKLAAAAAAFLATCHAVAEEAREP